MNGSKREGKNTKEAVKRGILHHLRRSLGRDRDEATAGDVFRALALTVRERLLLGMTSTRRRQALAGGKKVCYLSLEFLIGRSLKNNLLNLGLYDQTKAALADLGWDLEEIAEREWDAPLGNGGLGRLAACFLDSLATLGMAGQGYGLHYEYGLFRQEIDKGYQRERPDMEMGRQSPWAIERPEEWRPVPLYGRIEHGRDRLGAYNPMWLDWKVVLGVPYDVPIAGYGGETVNRLRLYAARASTEFDMEIFNEGDYFRAVEQKIAAETISKVLYPADTFEGGRELRLIQEYFLVSCALGDIVYEFRKSNEDLRRLPDRTVIHINDTHPALAVAELMRILVDEGELPWEEAWETARATVAYTNHTLMAEALEKWPVTLFEKVLPRHLQIIYEINRRLLDEVTARWPADMGRLQRMSLVEEGPEKRIRMANLAVVGSRAVNGVSRLHGELVKSHLFPDFQDWRPGIFLGITNGITPRRWLLQANPALAALVTEAVGPSWVTDLDRLRPLEDLASDGGFQEEMGRVKRVNKEALVKIVRETTGVAVDPGGLFDVHAKRIHEYKRQLLKLLHVIRRYLAVTEDGWTPPGPVTFIFAGKAAPGYRQAKGIIKAIHAVADVVNKDRRAAPWMKVVFLPDYRVSLAERLIPAADVSEQISTAGTEASGTGNMKFALNGALTVGTPDGANLEIRDEVGEENIYIFGLTAREVEEIRSSGRPAAAHVYETDPVVRRVVDTFRDDRFCREESGLMSWIWDRLIYEDPFLHLLDLPAYLAVQERVEGDFIDRETWTAKAIRNVARMGYFSSDRAVAEYARRVWMTGTEGHGEDPRLR